MNNNTFYNDYIHNIKTHNLFITEKTWRPIHTGHPFIISGNPNTLKILREWGFETFPEIFDESYDEYHGNQRDKFIVSEVKRVCKLDSKQKHDLFKSVEEKVIHNQNHFFENDKASRRMYKTIISNVWNEEYLLPWWLNHHKDLFDHDNNGLSKYR